MADGKPGVLARFKRFTTQREPVLSVATVAAFVLFLIDRQLGLTDDDLELLGMLLVPIVAGVVARLRAWSPESVEREIDAAYSEGRDDGRREARR